MHGADSCLEKKMKLLKLFVMIAIPFAGNPALAQGDASPVIKPSFSASQTVTATARVEAINHETREVTLLLEDGEQFTSRISDEARNLGQVSVGDIVYAHYTESVSIQVVSDDGAEPEAFIQEDVARSAEGRMPGIAASESAVATAIVEEINLDDNTFKLREPDGEVRQYTARNPDNLRRAEVGDKVITTVTTSVVITVDKQPNE
jgi:translation initiation factor IF-1